MFAIILIVYLLFCILYGIFVCPVLLVLLYYCRLYEINAFLYDRQNLDCIFVVLYIVWYLCLPCFLGTSVFLWIV